jgi:hypothetical protein
MNHSDALAYFEKQENDRRQGDRRMSPERRAGDAFDAAKVRAADEIFNMLNGVARPSGSGGFVMDDVKEILARAGYVFVGEAPGNRS